MEANELMVGAFVYFNCFDGSKIIVRVTGFKDGIVYGNSENGSHWCDIEKVEPISLTPEILEKNGFRVIYESELHITYFKYIQGFHVAVKVDKDGIFQKLSMNDGLGSGVTIVKCKFVHQLQHALRLCGIEKEIIL